MKKYVCAICGYVHTGDEPPAVCPVCGAGADKFKEMAAAPAAAPSAPAAAPKASGREWADEHRVGIAAGLDAEVVEMLRANFTGECSEVGMYLAMARVAHRGSCPAGRFARINAVVTARAHRCRGYARMLVREISRECLEQGWTPMLYTDACNPASNRSYAGAGFVRQGEIAEYAFAGEEA